MPRLCTNRSVPTLLTAVLALGTATTLAQGRIIIEPPGPDRPAPEPGQASLLLRALKIDAEITDGVVVTRVEQSFQNPLKRQAEGVYIFPLPPDVAVGDFSMTMDGKTLHGEVLDADAARKTYEDIVRRSRDPGLLELIGTRLFRARIFPIPPNGKVDVRIEYTQTLAEQAGLGLFQHPLQSDPARATTVDLLAIRVKLTSVVPLTTVFSPSHDCDIVRRGDHDATVTFEATNTRPDRDFMLYYQRKDDAFGVVLLTHRAAGEDGTFLLRVSPRIELEDDQVVPKDIVFVVDTSGSMAGPKIEQTRRALKYCLQNLNPKDRFNIYTFSTEVRPFRDELVAAGDADILNAALHFTDQIVARGGTNINGALAAAIDDNPCDDQRVYLVVFMTDGLPTVDVVDPGQILSNVASKNTRGVRFHVLGVGSEVNTHLLDKLAEATRGARDYCTENEDLELKLGAFVTRLANPVLTHLALRFAGIDVYDAYPQALPDLFRGSDLVVMGRYTGQGVASVELEGRVLDEVRVIGYEGEFPRLATTNDFLPRLWANRKVAYLLDQIRLHGMNKELVEEVVRLAKRYGIVTPFTSSLIVEEGVIVGAPIHLGTSGAPPATRGGTVPASDAMGGARQAGGRGDPADAAFLPDTGREAVEWSRALRVRKEAEATERGDKPLRDRAGRELRHVGDKTFVLIDERWTDTAWDETKPSRKVVAFSADYFDLIQKLTHLKKYFALGERVLVVIGDEVFETVPEERKE